MQLPYAFLEKSVNKQFKDLAFFQILKRKGPYIQRSLVKIENDLFYRHKLSGVKMKNVSFIKQIRQTLTAYEIIVNQIKNDFMMTQLDSLGQNIHRLFVQMISIINFFCGIILKKQRFSLHDDMKEINLQQMKQKQHLVTKRFQQQQKSKSQQQKQKQCQQRKQMEIMKYNFRELFKMEAANEKQNKIIEDLWKTIVSENKSNVKECMRIKDSQLTRIIQDSCQYLYKNHTELDNIVRLTKQDIVQAQKNISGFGDQAHLIQENQEKIYHAKKVAREIIHYVRQKVYDKQSVMTQTTFTNMDTSKPFMTIRELDQRRKMELRIKNYQKTTQERQLYMDQVEKKMKHTEEQLRIANHKLKLNQDSQSSSQGQSYKNSAKNASMANKLAKVGRKNKHNNFNSFKVNGKSNSMMNKIRESSLTTGKKFSKLQKKSSQTQAFYQKFSNRQSVTSKDRSLSHKNRVSLRNKSTRNVSQHNLDASCNVFGNKMHNKRFYKIRQSHLVIQAKSFQEISRKSDRSRAETDVVRSMQDIQEKMDEKVSGEQDQSVKQFISQKIMIKKNIHLKKAIVLSLSSQTMTIKIRPFLQKRFIQSTFKHPACQQKQKSIAAPLNQSSLPKPSKAKKTSSQHQVSRYYFQPLDNVDRLGISTIYKQNARNNDMYKKRILSQSTGSCQNALYMSYYRQTDKQGQISVSPFVPELNAVGFVKLKNQKQHKSISAKQDLSVLKGCIKSNLCSKKQIRRQAQNLLKKSSAAKQTVSFGNMPAQQKKCRKSYKLAYQNQKPKQAIFQSMNLISQKSKIYNQSGLQVNILRNFHDKETIGKENQL